jgi:hypothetical protein
MPVNLTGGTKRQISLRMSGRFYDRVAAIASRLNLPMSEVIIKAAIIGLDSSDDLAQEKRNVS